MPTPIHSITVYCSSSSAVPQIYRDASVALGQGIARRNWKLIYGGNNVGCMGILADAARAAGGKVVGITPKLFVDKGVCDNACDELIVCESMRERKHILEQRGDAFIALPGGLGTFEELFEIIVGKQLRYHTKPIALLNVAKYFDPLIAMIDHGIEHKFIKPVARDLFFVGSTPDEIFAHFDQYQPPAASDKWFSHTTKTTKC
jgi:hypothetical protein